ncbi:MAG: hypothetical protein LUD15_09840 [Bacteroides sp.]|nr:hypothetical protein [Bacteroides sp.]
MIRSVDGSQTVTWRVPLTAPGDYEIYYWAFSTESRSNRNAQGEYKFKIKHDGEEEEAWLDICRAGEE